MKICTRPKMLIPHLISYMKLYKGSTICFPIKKLNITSKRRPKWLSNGIKKSTKQKRKLHWMHKYNMQRDYISTIFYNNKYVYEPTEIANILNDFFVHLTQHSTNNSNILTLLQLLDFSP